jgi:hypothetical protein
MIVLCIEGSRSQVTKQHRTQIALCSSYGRLATSVPPRNMMGIMINYLQFYMLLRKVVKPVLSHRVGAGRTLRNKALIRTWEFITQ